MKTNLFILFLLMGTSLHSTSQTTFQISMNSDGGGNGFAAHQTTDGGYVWCGYTAWGLSAGSDVYLIKTNASGDTMWTKTYGGAVEDAGWSFQQTTDGGYIITGYTKNFGAGNEDVYLIKTDSIGNLSWSKTYGGTANDRGNSIQQTTDGGYIIAGLTDSYGAGSTDIFLMKTDMNGDTIWTKTYGGADADLATSVYQTADGGYILTGFTNSFGSGNSDLILIKTDFNGDPLWQEAFGGIGIDYAYSVQQTSDGGYIAAGYTTSFGAGGDDGYLVKTDSVGDLLWSKAYGGTASDKARNVQQATGGGYIFTGWSYSTSGGDADSYIIKTDSDGNVVWSNAFGGLSDDQSRYVEETSDGGYIITGGTTAISYDFHLIKTDSNGNSGCNQPSPTRIVTNPATAVTNAAAIVMSTGTIVSSAATIVESGADVTVVCSSVGINETTQYNSFSVFPNPSTGSFTISFKEILASGTVEVINVIGETVFSENIFNSSEKKINLENVPPGVYFVRIDNTYF